MAFSLISPRKLDQFRCNFADGWDLWKSDPIEFSAELLQWLWFWLTALKTDFCKVYDIILVTFPSPIFPKLGTKMWIIVLVNCIDAKFWNFCIKGLLPQTAKMAVFSVSLVWTLQCSGYFLANQIHSIPKTMCFS